MPPGLAKDQTFSGFSFVQPSLTHYNTKYYNTGDWRARRWQKWSRLKWKRKRSLTRKWSPDWLIDPPAQKCTFWVWHLFTFVNKIIVIIQMRRFAIIQFVTKYGAIMVVGEMHWDWKLHNHDWSASHQVLRYFRKSTKFQICLALCYIYLLSGMWNIDDQQRQIRI